MKKIILTVLMFVPMFVLAQNVDVSVLPQKAQNIIKTHLKSLQIISIEKDLSLLGTEYEVDFACGGEAEFNSDGGLNKIKCPKGIPQALIPAKIKTYLAKNYKSIEVTSLDNDKRDIEVELSNGLDLQFDLSGNFVRIDH